MKDSIVLSLILFAFIFICNGAYIIAPGFGFIVVGIGLLCGAAVIANTE